MKIATTIFGAAIFLSAAPVHAQQNIPYGPLPAQKLDLCVPMVHPIGAVVMVHGGGWGAGDKRGYAHFCQLYAANKLLAAAINYRLADGVHDAWPAQIGDVQLAIRWLKSKVASFGLSPGKVCAIGDSAGGHLVAVAATSPQTIDSDAAKILPDVSSQIACAVVNMGPLNFAIEPNIGTLKKLFPTMTADQKEARIAEVSPLLHVSKRTAPMLLSYGYDDADVPFSQALTMLNVLKQNGVPAEAIFYTGGHEWAGLGPEKRDRIIGAEISYISSSGAL